MKSCKSGEFIFLTGVIQATQPVVEIIAVISNVFKAWRTFLLLVDCKCRRERLNYLPILGCHGNHSEPSHEKFFSLHRKHITMGPVITIQCIHTIVFNNFVWWDLFGNTDTMCLWCVFHSVLFDLSKHITYCLITAWTFMEHSHMY